MSNTGVDLVADSSESEEELPPSRPATTGSAYFSNVINEVRTGTKATKPTAEARPGTKDTKPIAEARHQNTPVSRNLSRPRLAAQAVVHNWMPESHPADGTEAHATLEKNIKQNRDGLLRAAVKVCKTGHVVLVMHWSPSDPLNRKGTWSLEIFDCRMELWGDFGVEAHEQCKSLSTADDIVNALAKAMTERWETILPKNKESSDPICEWDDDKGKLLNDKFSKRLLPSLREIKRELRPLAIYAVGHIPHGQGWASRDDQNDKDENDRKNTRNQEDQRATKEELRAQRKSAQDRARLAHLRRIMDDRRDRQDLDRLHLGKLDVITRDAQRRVNGTGGVWNSDSRSFVPRFSIQPASAPELIDRVERIPTTPSRNKTDGSEKKPEFEKATKTTEEDVELKRIRAAARKDRERQEQEERAEEERQREVATQQEEAELRERDALEDTDSDEDINAARVEALENGSFVPEVSENEPAKTSQEEISVLESATEPLGDKPESNDRKQRQKPHASITSDSYDSDSVRPPVETKAKPATAKAIKEIKKEESTEGSQAEKTKSVKTKDPNPSRGKNQKKHKPKEFVSNSDVDNDETEQVKLSSDKLQAKDPSIETKETTNTIIHSEHGNNAIEKTIEIQQPNTSNDRASSSSNSSLATAHKIHTHTKPPTHLTTPHISPPPSPAPNLQDDFAAPANALGIDIKVRIASPVSQSPSASKKRKTPPPPPDGESCVERGYSYTSSKKHKISSPSPAQDGGVLTATASLGFGSGYVAESAESLTASSSSKKREVVGLEGDGEVGRSLGKKRARRGEYSSVVGSEGMKPEDKETVEAGLEVGLDDAGKVEGEDDAESWNSLFDE